MVLTIVLIIKRLRYDKIHEYLYKIGIKMSKMCDCEKEVGSLKHISLECKRY